MEYRKIL